MEPGQERTLGIFSLSAGLALLLVLASCSKNAETDYQTVTNTQATVQASAQAQTKQALKLPADHVCNSRLLEDPRVSAHLYRQYRDELTKAVIPQLRRNNWRGKKFISVQNIPNDVSRISPQYLIRIDLDNQIILRNKTLQTSLKVDTTPLPEINGCQITLQSRGSEYLVNQMDIPTNIYVPNIQVMHVVRFKDGIKRDLTDTTLTSTNKKRSINPRGSLHTRTHASFHHNNSGLYRQPQKRERYKKMVDQDGISYITD